MKILQVIQQVSLIVLIWAVLLFGALQLHANDECYEFNAPHAQLTLKGTVCSTTVDGTEFMSYLAVLKEKAGK